MESLTSALISLNIELLIHLFQDGVRRMASGLGSESAREKSFLELSLSDSKCLLSLVIGNLVAHF